MASKRKPKLDDEQSGSAYSAINARAHKGWTPDLFAVAERMVVAGDHTYAASICEWLLTDERVAGTLENRLMALFGLVPTFEPAGDRRRSSSAVKALEAGEDWWQSYPLDQLMLIHKWGLLLGVAPARHQPKYFEDHGGRLLPCPKFWHPQTLKR